MDHRKYSSEQYTNIQKKYLIRENKQLKMQLSQLKQINQMHKAALMTLSQEHLQRNKVISTLLEIIRGKPAAKRDLDLLKKISQLESQMMVIQKIADQATNSQKQTYNLLAQQFKILKNNNQQKEQSLNKFYQKIGEVDYLSGLVTKYVQIYTPSKEVLSFQKQKQQLLDALNLLKQQNKKISDQRQKLMKINVHLKQQLDKRKDEIRNMTMYLNNSITQYNNINQGQMILQQLQNQKQLNRSINSNGNISTTLGNGFQNFNNNNNFSMMNVSSLGGNNNSTLNNTMNFIRLQKELIRQDKDDQQSSQFSEVDVILECPQLYNLFPDRVQRLSSNRHKKRVPYLNMLKVRQLMAKRQSKLKKEMQEANANVNPTTKIIKLQGDLQITRKQLSNLMLKFRTVSDDNKKMQNILAQLQHRNILLLEANQKLVKYNQTLRDQSTKYRKMINDIQIVTGRKLLNQNINQQDMARILRQSTRRNTWDQLLNNVLISIPHPIKRCVSL